MIDRYAVTEISDLWSETAKLKTWLKVELAVYEANSIIKIIPAEAWTKLANLNLEVNVKRMHALEETTKHDVVAFTTMITEQITDPKVAKWFHYGLTSTDVVDTTNHLLLKKSNELSAKVLQALCATVKKLAIQYKNTLIIGRTHGMYAEPMSFGLKFVNFYAELKRQHKRLQEASTELATVKLSGAMGNFVNLDPQVEQIVAQKLNLRVDTISNQVAQRDRHCHLVQVYANLSTTLAKIALEIRHLQRSEVAEAAEGFSEQQKGSSAMPHKKNPVGCENIMGLARVVESYSAIALANNVLWHERDISHSSTERIMWVDLYHLIIYMTRRLNGILKNLYVNETQMQKRIMKHLEVCSQYWLNWLLKHSAMTREKAYVIVQQMFAFDDRTAQAIFWKRYGLQPLAWDDLKKHYLQNIDYLYDKVFRHATSN